MNQRDVLIHFRKIDWLQESRAEVRIQQDDTRIRTVYLAHVRNHSSLVNS